MPQCLCVHLQGARLTNKLASLIQCFPSVTWSVGARQVGWGWGETGTRYSEVARHPPHPQTRRAAGDQSESDFCTFSAGMREGVCCLREKRPPTLPFLPPGHCPSLATRALACCFSGIQLLWGTYSFLLSPVLLTSK